MRRLLLLLLPCCLLFAGCWDYKDLNKLSIVSGIAFDNAKDGGITVTMEIVDRSSSPRQDGLRTRTVKASGKNPDQAVYKLSKTLDFELYYGAMAVAVFGKNVPCGELKTWLLQNREVRETVYVIYAEEGWKKLQTEEDGGIAAFKLRDILNASKEKSPVELYQIGRWER